MPCQPVETGPPTGPEIAEIIRQFAHLLPALTPDQARVLRDLANCRTAALGGHLQECDRCGHLEPFLNSCLNRHCPKCQSLNQARWLEARQADLLPVEYFHLVFTVSDVLQPLFIANQKACYNLLFRAVSETLKEVALNPKHLGAQVGLLAVLHTWTQTLLYHPHVHCIVPGGGLTPDGEEWRSCKQGFFLPVKVLSKVFKGKLLSKLEKAVQTGELRLPQGNPLALLKQAARKKWNVYSKAPFGGPDQVLRYLGRYTHRIAISNHRLVAIDERQVSFEWKDRADGGKKKTMTLDGDDFLRRFLLHVLPAGFMRIRYYGFLANAVRENSIALCRKLLGDQPTYEKPNPDACPAETSQELMQRLTGSDPSRCPACKLGRLIPTLEIPACEPWSIPSKAASP